VVPKVAAVLTASSGNVARNYYSMQSNKMKLITTKKV